MQLTQYTKARIFGLVSGAIIAAFIASAYFYTKNKEENWKTTTGVITYLYEVKWTDYGYGRFSNKPAEHIYLNYQYKVEGKTYNRFEELNIYLYPNPTVLAKYQLHNQIPIKYNPEVPSQSFIDEFQNDFFADQQNQNLLTLGIFFLPLLIIIPFFIVLTRKSWNMRLNNIPSYKKTIGMKPK